MAAAVLIGAASRVQAVVPASMPSVVTAQTLGVRCDTGGMEAEALVRSSNQAAAVASGSSLERWTWPPLPGSGPVDMLMWGGAQLS